MAGELTAVRAPSQARAHGQSCTPCSPPPLQVSRTAVVPTPSSPGGDVRPLDRAPAPPLPAAPGASGFAAAAGPAAGHAGCSKQSGQQGAPVGSCSGLTSGRGAFRRNSGLPPRHTCPTGRTAAASAGSAPAAPRDRGTPSQPQLSISALASQLPVTVRAAPPGIYDWRAEQPMRLGSQRLGLGAGANEHHFRWVEGADLGKVASFGLLTSSLGDGRANGPVGLGAAVTGVELAQ